MVDALLCICGSRLNLSNVSIKKCDGGPSELLVICGNPSCDLKEVAKIILKRSDIELRLSKMVKEFNMLLVGYETMQSSVKRFEKEIRTLFRRKT